MIRDRDASRDAPDHSRRLPPRRDVAARDALVRQWTYLPDFCVTRWFAACWPGMTRDDLVQEGYLALIRAAELWDADRLTDGRPVQFNTYATRTIRSRLAAARRNAGLIRIPSYLQERGQQGTPAALAAAERVKHVGPLPGHYEGVAREEKAPGFGEDVALALRRIPGPYRECLRLRFVEGLTLKEIGARWGITREAVRQKQGRALKELRKRLGVGVKAA